MPGAANVGRSAWPQVAAWRTSRPALDRPTTTYRDHNYVIDTMLTTIRTCARSLTSLLIEGRLLETILKAERGVASCGRGS
jgi:hypothetical protein